MAAAGSLEKGSPDAEGQHSDAHCGTTWEFISWLPVHLPEHLPQGSHTSIFISPPASSFSCAVRGTNGAAAGPHLCAHTDSFPQLRSCLEPAQREKEAVIHPFLCSWCYFSTNSRQAGVQGSSWQLCGCWSLEHPYPRGHSCRQQPQECTAKR